MNDSVFGLGNTRTAITGITNTDSENELPRGSDTWTSKIHLPKDRGE
jgi:hypothetical protein